MRRFRFALAFSAALVAGFAAIVALGAVAEPAPQHAAALARARAKLRQAEQVHQREVELHKKKLIDEAQLNAGRARLAEARVEVAILEDDQDSVVANLEIIVQGRQRDLDRTSQLRDKKVLSDNDVDEARLALAVARIHLELQRIILIRKGQLQRVLASQRQGIVTQADVGRAQRNLADARERLRLLPGQHTAP